MIDDDLYYSEYLGGRVSKINLNDENPIPDTVISDLGGPYGLAFSDDKLYIADNVNGEIVMKDIHLVLNDLDLQNYHNKQTHLNQGHPNQYCKENLLLNLRNISCFRISQSL